MNIDHGDNSRITILVDFGALLSAGAATVGDTGAVVVGAARTACDVACEDWESGGAAAAGGCCWATATEAAAAIINAMSNLRTILNIAALSFGSVASTW
jgi:hypothetical protein